MKPRTLHVALKGFTDKASGSAYLVDVYLKGAGERATFSGTMGEPDMGHGAVKMTLYQYGPGTDFGDVMIDIEDIAAVRMRKPQ